MSSLITIVLFIVARYLYRNWPFLFFVPVFFSVVGCILYLMLFDLSYSRYFEENRLLTFLLSPAVVALGVLLHKQMQSMKNQLFPLLVSVTCGSFLSVMMVAFLAVLLSLPAGLSASLIPLGITTPIAIEVTQPLGGDPAITSVVVISVGLLGNMVSPLWLRWFRIKNNAAAGVAIGTVSHGIGTARAIQLSETTGVFSGLAMCINGLITVFSAPLVWGLFFG